MSLRPSRSCTVAMLLLFETAAGYALFKVLKEGKLQEAEVRFVPGVYSQSAAICALTVDYHHAHRMHMHIASRKGALHGTQRPGVLCRTYLQISAQQQEQTRSSSSRHSANSRTQLKLLQQLLHLWTASSAKVLACRTQSAATQGTSLNKALQPG